MDRREIWMSAAVVLVGACTASGTLVTYTAEGVDPMHFPAAVTPPANAPWGPSGYPGDTVAVTGYSGTLELKPGSFVRKINTLGWTIDYTYGGTAEDPDAWRDLNFAVSMARSLSIDGSTPKTLSQSGQLRATWENDYLSFTDGDAVSFLVQGYQIRVTPLGLDEVGGSNFSGGNPWTQPSHDLVARFEITPVPEPTTIIAGFLMALPLAWTQMQSGAQKIAGVRKR